VSFLTNYADSSFCGILHVRRRIGASALCIFDRRADADERPEALVKRLRDIGEDEAVLELSRQIFRSILACMIYARVQRAGRL
jgi:hypothetical protein